MSNGTRIRVCFYARLRDRGVLDRVEFYRQDLHALQQAGFEVVIATCWAEIPRDVDFFLIWWWTWAWQPLLAARLARRPAIVTGVFDYRWPEPGIDYVNRPLWQRLPMRAALRVADANVFIAQCEIRQVTEALPVTRPLCMPLGVDMTRYQPGTAPRQPFVLSIGWLSAENARRKCMFEVVRAAAIVLAQRPGLRFVIAGQQGTGFPELQALSAQLGIADRIEWAGAVSEEEKIRLLQTCAVYVQPSVYEGFGLVPFEARQLGFGIGLDGAQVNRFVKVAAALYETFVATDATLLEINPLVVTAAGDVIALDAKISFDDNALFRHPELEKLRDKHEKGTLSDEEYERARARLRRY
jgi:glycosyltransferase involved in cell wall biosynthesis